MSVGPEFTKSHLDSQVGSVTCLFDQLHIL